MKDAKFNMNKPPLSEQEINAAKDFDKILKGAGAVEPEPKPKGKLKYIIGGLVVALIGGVAWFWPAKKEVPKVVEEKVDVSTLNVNPLIKGLDVAKDQYTINAATGGTLTTPNGTTIIIPPNAFMNDKDNIITGDVTLHFREFHDVPSIFAAGINMTYDSAGVEYHFESAGMFEIQGMKGEEQLFTNPSAPIVVELASAQPGDYYNIYYQDPKDGWQFIRKDTAARIANVPTLDSATLLVKQVELTALKKDYKSAEKSFKKSLKKEGMIMPEKADDDLYAMKIAFKNAEFPELAGYKNMLFEITEANEDFDPKLAQQEWSQIELKKNLLGVYVMHLYGKTKEKLFVRPVFAGEDMEMANADFEEIFANYNATSDGKLAKERKELQEMALVYANREQEVYDAYNASIGFNNNLGLIEGNQEKVKRIFTVANFGMWNSDCPSILPKGQEVFPVFVNEDNEKDTLNFSTLFIAEYGKNALYTYWGDWGNKDFIDEKGKKTRLFENPVFTFNPKNETVVWFVTNEGNLAIIKPDDLKKIIFNKDNTAIKMKVEKVVPDVKTVKKLLGWK